MANFFTKAFDWLTPWNRKGEVQRRKKKDEEEQRVQQQRRPVRTNQYSAEPDTLDQPLQVKKPVNVFDVNKNLALGQNKPGVVPVFNNPIAVTPAPGTVIKPKTENDQKIADINKIQASFRAGKINQAQRDQQAQRTLGTEPKKVNVPREVFNEIALTPKKLQVDLPTWVAKQAVRGVDETVRTGLEYGAQGIYGKENVKPGTFSQGKGKIFGDGKGPVSKFLYGDEPVKTYQEQGPQLAGSLRKYGLNKTANVVEKSGAPILFGLGLLDLVTGGGKKKAAEEALGEGGEALVKRGVLDKLLNVFRKVPNETGEIPINIKPKKPPQVIDDLLSEAEIADIKKPPTNIPVRNEKTIPVREVQTDNLDVPVSVKTPPKPMIRDFQGDATTAGRMPTSEEIQTRRFNEQAPGRPDRTIEGVTPRAGEGPFVLDDAVAAKNQDEVIDSYADMIRDLGEGNGTQLVPSRDVNGFVRTSNNVRTPELKGKRMTKRAWREEAERQLREGKAEPALQKAYNEAGDPEVQSLMKSEQPDAPLGSPIAVKQVTDIPVTDNTVVPQGLPEVPGTVRATNVTEPMQVKTQAVAQQLPPIPKVGSTLPDGRKVTKRMVESARNQRKNAKALAKAQDETAAAMEQVNASNAPNNALDSRQPGLILSDDTGKGKKGVYQVAHQADQTNELGTKSVGQVIEEADTSVRNNGSLTDRDIANVKAALDNTKPKTPEHKKLSDLYWKDGGTHDAQRLALRNQSLRRTGSAKEIYNRAVSKIVALADDPSKITDAQIANIEKTANEFADVRDNVAKAADDFNANPTKDNYKRYMDFEKQVTKAEKNMAMAQYNAAKNALKGNTNVKLKRLIEDAAEDADLYTMDYVDSALLSGTGTFVRNFVNASLGSAEEGIFGGLGARVGSLIKGTPIGGGVGRGSFSGFGKGVNNIVDASKTRAKNAGWNPIEHMKNWSTTGNQLGDSMIEGSIGRSVRNHYEQILKKQGYVGDELRMRTDVMARQDPEDLARDLYAPQARKDAGLGSGVSKRSALEKSAQREIADGIARVMGKEYSQGGEVFAKGITRIVMGFPSAIGRSLAAGSQRLVPFANIDTIKAFTAPSPTLRAAAIKESIKKSGSAATAAAVFGVLGANNMVTGAYPKDQNERDRWEREGIKENSIKIGDAWYDAPSYLGSFGLPVLAWASIGRHGGVNKESLADIRAIVGSISPTENISDINDVLDGRIDIGKYTQNVASSAVRMATPYGSLLNQLSKVFDKTQNDTSGDSWTEGFFNKMIDGIPFLDKSLPDKTDKEGNTLTNPSGFETMIGASGAVQKGGEERSGEINQEINDSLDKIDKYGLLDDPNMKGVLKDTGLEAFNKAKAGKQLDESEAKALKAGLVKGVSSEGTDTAYLERGQYDTNLAVLKMKRDLMNSDPTVKPSSLKDIDVAIKRGEIYKEDKIPYEFITAYKDTSLTEWRNMGNPEDDDYNLEMYEKLWAMDEKMANAGVSYKSGSLDKQKYYAKKSRGRGRGRSGSGGRGGKGKTQTDFSFGTLKDGSFAPRVKEYASIDSQSGAVPVIRRTRPNIVHKITSSG